MLDLQRATVKTWKKCKDHGRFLGGTGGFGGSRHPPHQADHGVQVVHQRLVPAEDLGTGVLVIGEPVTVFLHQLQVPTGIEDLLKVPGVGEPTKLASRGCKVSIAAPLSRAGHGEGWHSRHVVAGPVALLVQQLCLISHHHQAPVLGGRALVKVEGEKATGDSGGHAGLDTYWGSPLWGSLPSQRCWAPITSVPEPLATDTPHGPVTTHWTGQAPPSGLSQTHRDERGDSRDSGSNGATHGICSSTVSTPSAGLALPGVKAL